MSYGNNTESVPQEGMSYTLHLKDGRKIQNAIYHPCVIGGQHYFSKGNEVYPFENVLTHSLIGHNVPDNYQEDDCLNPNCLVITDSYDKPIVVSTSLDVNPIIFQRRVQSLILSGLSQEEAEHIALTTPVELELFYDIGRGIFAIDAEAVGNTPLYNPYTGKEIPDKTT